MKGKLIMIITILILLVLSVWLCIQRNELLFTAGLTLMILSLLAFIGAVKFLEMPNKDMYHITEDEDFIK